MEFRSLKLIDRFQWVFTRMGIDYGTMRKILNLKLIMDSRRIPTAIQNNKKGKDDTGQGNNMLKSLWMYALFSVMPGIMAFIPIPIFSKISIIMGISMFLIMSTMISDFSSVLLDIRDKNILMAFPVDSRTLSAAKLVHICIYLSLITGSLNFIPLIGIAYSEGILMGLLLLLMLVFMVMVVIFLTSLMYVLVLKKFDGEKLKDLISSIQIMLTVAMTLGYQVVARMFEFSNVHVQFTPKWWTILLPPTWFAAPFALLSGQRGFLYILLAILGVCLPLVFIILHFKVITPLFEANLVKLNTSDKHASKAYNRRQVRVKNYQKFSVAAKMNRQPSNLDTECSAVKENSSKRSTLPWPCPLSSPSYLGQHWSVTRAEFLRPLNHLEHLTSIFGSIFQSLFCHRSLFSLAEVSIIRGLALQSPPY